MLPEASVYCRTGWENYDFAMVRKDLLTTEFLPFQRKEELGERKKRNVKRIRDNFVPPCVGAIIVKKENGVYNVCDGGTRLSAMSDMDEIVYVPCMVYTGDIPAAVIFMILNEGRAKLPQSCTYRSKIAAGDYAALGVQEIIEKTGHMISYRHIDDRSIKFPAKLLKSFEADPQLTTDVWSLVTEIVGEETIENQLWRAFEYLEKKARMRGSSLQKYKKILKNAGPAEISRWITKSKLYYETGGSKIFAHGLQSLLNSKLNGNGQVNWIDITAKD